MNPPTLPSTEPLPRRRLAVASLVLGCLALVTSLLVIGALLGIIGLVCGGLHLRRKQPRNGLAWAGMILCTFGLMAGIGFGVSYYVYFTSPEFKEAWHDLTHPASPQIDAQEFKAWTGVAAPDFSVTTLDGKTIRLSELRGKRVVLDFWATWCPPCVMEIPHFIQLRKDTAADDLVLVGISTEDEATLKAFVAKQGINYPIASADALPAPYKEVSSIPTTFCIDRRGIIQNVLVGYHDLAALKASTLGADFTGDPKPAPK